LPLLKFQPSYQVAICVHGINTYVLLIIFLRA